MPCFVIAAQKTTLGAFPAVFEASGKNAQAATPLSFFAARLIKDTGVIDARSQVLAAAGPQF